MSVPKPPFHSVSEELLYNIYLKIQTMDALQESDINTLAKLNAILTDAQLMKSEDVALAIQAIKGNVPQAGDTLEKLFNILQGLTFLKAEDIDTLAELNTILADANLIKTEDLQNAISSLRGSVPAAADTLEKLYNLVTPVLTAWVKDGNEVATIKGIGTKNNFALPFITNNVERGRFDTAGNFSIGYAGAAIGRLHIRAINSFDNGVAFYIDDPASTRICSISNNGRLSLGQGGIELYNYNIENHGKIYTDNVFINFTAGSFRGMQFWTTGGNKLLLRLGNTSVFETGAGLIHDDALLDNAGGKGYLMIDGTKYTRSGTIWWGDPVGEEPPRDNALFPNATRSIGARLIFKRINAPNAGDYGLGYEQNFMWFSSSKNDNTNGFKFYARDVQILKLLGDGSLISPAAAAHYFGDENTDGTWRLIRVGTDIVFQRREAGAYVTKQTVKS
jgi:hypothetical protein